MAGPPCATSGNQTVPRWIRDDPREEAAMLGELGLRDIEELFRDVPRKARVGRLGLGAGADERAVVQEVDRLLSRNKPYSRFAQFLGGRVATRYTPAALDALLSRSEFYTSYTPYQPEASQGMLQALFEFQSLWVELSGLDVANASLYDGASALGESLLFCRRIHDGRRFLIPASLPWEEKSVLANYASGPDLIVTEIPYDETTGCLDTGRLTEELARGDVFGVLADLPNGFGHLDEALPDLKSLAKDVPVVVHADPLALSVLEPPGAYGADVVVGEGQGFGLPPSFGGPLLGLFACRREHVRQAPGRLVGATVDARGERAFCLTLTTREQHIRRSKATSNICTNDSLIALGFLFYAALQGPRGLARIATELSEHARTLAAALGEIDGLDAPRFESPFLSEFTIELGRGSAAEFLERLARRKVLGGIDLADPRPGRPRDPERILVAATETTDDRAIQRYVRAARSILEGGAP